MSSLGYYIAVILPVFIFHEANDRLAEFLKKKNIYQHWDSWHCALLLLIIAYIVLAILGY
jgi:hypothetical protein